MRFNIAIKIILGFGIILAIVLSVFAITYSTANSTSSTLTDGIEEYSYISLYSDPSLQDLIRLKENIEESENLIVRWATVPSYPEHPDKRRLQKICDTIIPKVLERSLMSNIDSLRIIDQVAAAAVSKDSVGNSNLNAENRSLVINASDTLERIFRDIDTLFDKYQEIKELFPNLASYDSVFNNIQGTFLIAPDGELRSRARKVSTDLTNFITMVREDNERRSSDMTNAFEQSETDLANVINIIFYCILAVVGIIVVVTMLTTRSIVRPVKELKGMLIKLGKGIIPEREIKPSNDEIGDMSVAMNKLVRGLNHTTEFARQVGQSNFDYEYQPLSDEDTLGHALMKMRDDLAENERILEQKVIERTEEVVRQKGELEQQKMRIEELYKDVTDSIKYAKRLQDSILPPDNKIAKLIPESFVLFKPKDIVSGDFYWMEETTDKIHIAAVDCTGHGVPGAFMSLVGSNALNIAVQGNKLNTPADILTDLNRLTAESLNKSEGNSKVRDGMDLALISFTKNFDAMEYAGANNPLYHVRGDKLTQTKADKFAIGSFAHGEKQYTNHKIEVKKGDLIYIFSDGYADQFGGMKGKKFMYRQFRELLMEIRELPMREQGNILNEKIENWRGNYEQIDDILVIGVRV